MYLYLYCSVFVLQRICNANGVNIFPTPGPTLSSANSGYLTLGQQTFLLTDLYSLITLSSFELTLKITYKCEDELEQRRSQHFQEKLILPMVSTIKEGSRGVKFCLRTLPIQLDLRAGAGAGYQGGASPDFFPP